MFRNLLRMVIIGAAVFFAGRFLLEKRNEFYGLTESEARAKLSEKMAPRIGQDTAAEIADQVIPVLKERGIVREDTIDEVAREARQHQDGGADTVGDAVDAAEKDRAASA